MEDLNTQKLEALPIMFTTTEVAQILGVTQRTLYNWIKDETLEAVNVNGRWRITKDALQSFIDSAYVHKMTLADIHFIHRICIWCYLCFLSK